jgi:hypothetical protein
MLHTYTTATQYSMFKQMVQMVTAVLGLQLIFEWKAFS